MRVGVLAVQGDFAEHLAVLRDLHAEADEVRTVDELADADALVMPGGESTVMAGFLDRTGLGSAIIRRVRHGSLAVFATCAGAILLARRVRGKNAPRPLKLLDITVDRNAYGEQLDSFETPLRVRGLPRPIRVSFIRAPIITRVGRGVEILAEHGGHPVVVCAGRLLAAACHPEVRGETALHEFFLDSVAKKQR